MDQHTRLTLSRLRVRFQEIYGPRLARLILYGSRARGDADPDSDIDILVVLHGIVDASEEIERCGQMTADLSLEMGLVIACVFLSEDDFNRRQGPLLRNVRREGVIV